ncbi:MAG: recombinase family protein [candidate division NC10 bacterium]
MRKMAGYVRVSSAGQVKHKKGTNLKEGESLHTQAQRLKREADLKGWALTIFTEAGISARDTDRPQYQAMRDALEAGKFDGIMCCKLDRLWRSTRLALNEVYAFCTKWGKDLIALDEKFDTTTPVGRVMLTILLAFAEFERERIVSRTQEGMDALREAGRWRGGAVPYGYETRANGDEIRLVPHPAEAPIVSALFDFFLSHGTIYKTVRVANAAGHRTRAGHLWIPTSVRRLLANPIYSSQPSYCPEALVDEATASQAKALLEHRPKTARIPHNSIYLLAGMVKCSCGGNMTGHAVRKRKGGKLYRYYRCTAHAQVGTAKCPGLAVHAQPLEDKVTEALFDLSLDPKKLRAMLASETATRQKLVPPLQKEVQRLRRAVAAVEQRDARIQVGFTKGLYTLEEAVAQRTQAATERSALDAAYAEAQEKLAHAEADTTDVDFVVGCLEHLWDVYKELDFDGKRELLRGVIEGVALESPERGVLTVQHLDDDLITNGRGGKRVLAIGAKGL